MTSGFAIQPERATLGCRATCRAAQVLGLECAQLGAFPGDWAAMATIGYQRLPPFGFGGPSPSPAFPPEKKGGKKEGRRWACRCGTSGASGELELQPAGRGRLLVSGERFPRRPLEFSVARRRAMAPTPYSRLVTASPFPAITALCLSRSMLILWRAVSPAPQPISR